MDASRRYWEAFVSASGSGAKFETCRHCGEGYDVAGNTHESCLWHYEEGPTDSKENRKRLPQGFFWDCCGLQLNSTGYLHTKHAPPPEPLTRNGRVLEANDSGRVKTRHASEIYEGRAAEGPSPTKKRKTGLKCRMCRETYDDKKNTKKGCHWHELDAVRRFTGEREDWDSDNDADAVYSQNDEEDEEDNDDLSI
ncbi:hypothetical protein B0H16DRAFT_1475797 [Mycena metata]|uniref:Uncharacterized protein n=1 Tax=Mycena metata TaxID=1033252 RepID=A0AAD7HE11_9AGAR|nr:hypothetical protein B0H16DRAFT_1475797 [Mycena metata]